jgi:hypothetical protein
MAINDKVKVGLGKLEVSKDSNIAVYDLQTDQDGNVVFDINGAANPKVIGGVKGASDGFIVGNPVRVSKNLLVGLKEGVASMGMEYVLMLPIKFDYYQRTAWVPADFVKIVG